METKRRISLCAGDPACEREALPGGDYCVEHIKDATKFDTEIQQGADVAMRVVGMARKGSTWQEIVEAVPGVTPRQAQIEVLVARIQAHDKWADENLFDETRANRAHG